MKCFRLLLIVFTFAALPLFAQTDEKESGIFAPFSAIRAGAWAGTALFGDAAGFESSIALYTPIWLSRRMDIAAGCSVDYRSATASGFEQSCVFGLVSLDVTFLFFSKVEGLFAGAGLAGGGGWTGIRGSFSADFAAFVLRPYARAGWQFRTWDLSLLSGYEIMSFEDKISYSISAGLLVTCKLLPQPLPATIIIRRM